MCTEEHETPRLGANYLAFAMPMVRVLREALVRNKTALHPPAAPGARAFPAIDLIETLPGAAAMFRNDKLVLSNAHYRTLTGCLEIASKPEQTRSDFIYAIGCSAARGGSLSVLMNEVPHGPLPNYPEPTCDDVKVWADWWLKKPVTEPQEFTIRLRDKRWIKILELPGQDDSIVVLIDDVSKEKSIEQDLLRKTEDYSLCLTVTNQAMWYWESGDNLIRFSEERWANLFFEDAVSGFPIEDWVGLIHPEDRPIFLKHYVAFDKGETESFDCDYRILSIAGEHIWVRTVAQCTRHRDGSPKKVFGSTYDISDQKQLELALRESEEKYALAVEAMHGLAWEWDAETSQLRTKPGRIVDHSLTAFNADGGGEKFLDMVHPADRKRYLETFAAHLKNETEYYTCEYRVRGPDGKYAWVSDRAIGIRDEQGRVTRMVGAVVNVNKEKQAEIALKEREQSYRLVIDALHGTFYRWTAEKNIIEAPQDNWDRLELDWTCQEFRWDEWQAIIHPDDLGPYMKAYDGFLRGKPERLDEEYRIRNKEGEYIWVHDQALGWYGNNGRVLRLVGMMSNINDRKMAEKELVAAKEKAELANRSKSQFLANMSHELRTPLNAIIGYADLLYEDLSDCKPKGACSSVSDATKIGQSAKHLLKLINEVLDLSKVEAGHSQIQVEEADLKSLIDEVCQTVKPLAAAKHNWFHYSGPVELGRIFSDSDKIKQCLLNLLGNACKFTENGDVTLEVTFHEESGADWITFCITDDGIGISEDQLERLFKPFTQADETITREYGGTGLGLAITERLVSLVGGRIEVKSELGEGSEFKVIVPRRVPNECADQSDIDSCSEEQAAG